MTVLTAPELAARWRVPVSTIHRLRRAGVLRGIPGLRHARFTEAEVLAYESEGYGMSPELRRFSRAVEEMRWYRFGYIGPALGAVEEINGEQMQLTDLRIRPTTDEEMNTPSHIFYQSEMVAMLHWEPLDEAARRIEEAIG